ncbi:MAG: hypothetical protein RLZZ157_1712, partial [Pseudomonadota bacterium]
LTLTSACATTQTRFDAYSDRGRAVSRGSNGAQASLPVRGTYGARQGASARQSVAPERVVAANWLRPQPPAPLAFRATSGLSSGTFAPIYEPAPQVAGRAMGVGRVETAPAGLLDLCRRMPQFCSLTQSEERSNGFVRTSYTEIAPRTLRQSGVDTNTAAAQAILPIGWTVETRAMVNQINRRINDAMIGSTDLIAFGRQELWTFPLSAPERPTGRSRPLADCEDFALEKRRALLEAGVPASALYLAVAVSEQTGLHAVLVVATDQGDFVLDNMNDWVVEWSKTNYVWIKRQTSTSMLDWAFVGNQAPYPARGAPPAPEFIPEPAAPSPFILADLKPAPLELGHPMLMVNSNARTAPSSLGQPSMVRGFRGFTSPNPPQYVTPGKATAGTSSDRDWSLASAHTPASGSKGQWAALLPPSDPWAVVPLALSSPAPVGTPSQTREVLLPVEGNMRLTLSQVRLDWPTGSAQTHLRVALPAHLQTLPEQPQFFRRFDGSLTAINPQRSPDFERASLRSNRGKGNS